MATLPTIPNASSLVSSNTLSNLNSSSIPKAFGDQLKNKAKEKIVKPVTDELTRLLEEKKDLITEEIRLEIEHQRRLLAIQMGNLNPLSDGIIFPTSGDPEIDRYLPFLYKDVDREIPTEEEINAFKDLYLATFRISDNVNRGDGTDVMYYEIKLGKFLNNIENRPYTEKIIPAWLIYLPGSPPPDNEPSEVIEEDTLPPQMKKRVDEGKRIAVFNSQYKIQERKNYSSRRYQEIVRALQIRYWDKEARNLKPEFR